tara:strand:+ start:613 stop:1359 length:747 start_codon:yes stop_codon:yes gene_type:complete
MKAMDIGSSTSSSSISSTSSKKNTQLDIELVVLNPQKEDEATTSSPSDNNNNIENNLLPDTYYNRFHIWLHPPTKPRAVQLFRLENLAIPACYFLVGALQGLSGALMNVYPLDLGATEAQQVTVAALRSLPASFKLVYGFISDGHPLWGYRRKSYMVCGWTVAGISMVFLALPATPSIPYLSLCYFMFGLGFWYADVMADSVVAEKAKLEPEDSRGALQSTCYGCRFFALMVFAPISTVMYEKIGPKR